MAVSEAMNGVAGTPLPSSARSRLGSVVRWARAVHLLTVEVSRPAHHHLLMSDGGSILLDAVLRPAPALSARALGAILGIVGAINLAFAITFLARGAWPITPFMGLDVVLLGFAFRAARRAARREEHIVVTPSELSILRRSPEGEESRTAFNPYWVRVAMDDPPQHGSQLLLWSHGKSVRIGAFLPPVERATFAQTLRQALSLAKSARFGS